jgi:hypothetical protein
VPADQQRYMACNADIYDLASSLIINRTPTNPNAVMEFIVDCYTAMWQNILRNGELPCFNLNPLMKHVLR